MRGGVTKESKIELFTAEFGFQEIRSNNIEFQLKTDQEFYYIIRIILFVWQKYTPNKSNILIHVYRLCPKTINKLR